jgi:hypothetical protein
MKKTPCFLSFGNGILSFTVSETFRVSETLTRCTKEQFESSLHFAMSLIDIETSLSDEYTRKHIFADYLKEIEKKHQDQLTSVHSEYMLKLSTSLSPLISKLQEMESSYSLRETAMKQDYEQRLKILQKSHDSLESEHLQSENDIEQAFKKEEKGLRKRICELELELQSSSCSESSIREKCNQEFQRLLSALETKNEEIIKIKEDILQRREDILTRKEQELQIKIQRSMSSVFRGQDGESFFASIVKEKRGWDLVNTSKIPHSCDYSSSILNTPVFFEVKNHSSQVKEKEVTKFLRDMKEHPEVFVGVFISLNTGISGKSPTTPILLDWIHNNQCVMFIQSLSELDIDHCLSLIEQLVSITKLFHRHIQIADEKEDTTKFQQRIDRAKGFLDASIQRGNKLMKRILTDKKAQIESIETMTSNTISELKHQQADITSCIDALLGEYSEPVEEIQETETLKKQKKK